MSLPNVNNLTQLIEYWAGKVAEQHNTTYKWVDVFAEHADMKNKYDHIKLNIQAHNLQYNEGEPLIAPIQIFKENFTNDSDNPQIFELIREQTSIAKTQWEVTKGTEISFGAQLTVGTPSNFEGLAKQGQVNFGHKKINTTTGVTVEEKQQKWSVNHKFTVGPRHEAEAHIVIEEANFNIPFTATVEVSGQFAVWFNDKIDLNMGEDLHWLWFPHIDEVFNGRYLAGTFPTPDGFEVTTNNLKCNMQGIFTGVIGLHVKADYDQYPLAS
jgi:hypothetical protein